MQYRKSLIAYLKRFKRRFQKGSTLYKAGLVLVLLLSMATPIQATRSLQEAHNKDEALTELKGTVTETLSTSRELMKEFAKKQLREEATGTRDVVVQDERESDVWYADNGEKYQIRKINRKAVLPQKNTDHYFYTGNCTHYINAIYDIPWRGNAIRWYDNAQKMGFEVSETPAVGDLLITAEGPASVGHVSLVEEVNTDTITISEMNYAGYAWMTERVVPKDYSKIVGYIKGDQLEKRTELLDTINAQLANSEEAKELKKEVKRG
ncbi:MAG: CHAP domain-containing protein [Candidatus Gracilibacteria bacterium]|nr:CHAP domain-containing protein [Candidatus Gracilibacteria bacterium]